ncbi:acyltransferase [Paenarthrobacter sp. PAE-2]|uniref:acyltransferase n=1 Tax=Paenarthrobacter sp. PAE-2 TaxID=2982532 RepID=UPI0039B6F419
MDIRELFRNTFVASPFMPPGARTQMLRRMGLRLGAGTAVASRVTFKGTAVTTGKGCFFNHEVYIDRGPLTMGEKVYVGPRVVFATRNHEIGQAGQRAGANVDQPIVVGDGVWVGANVTVLGGVTIAPGCIIAAGAVLAKDTEPNGVYAGTPARRIKEL